jgi:hypothetical protein
MFYPTLTAGNKTLLLRVLFPEFTAGGVGTWRVQFDKRSKKGRLWEMVSSFEDEATKLRIKDNGDGGGDGVGDGGGDGTADSDDDQAAFAKIVMAKAVMAKATTKEAKNGGKSGGSMLRLAKKEGGKGKIKAKGKRAAMGESASASSSASSSSDSTHAVSPPVFAKRQRLGPLSSSVLACLEKHLRAYQQHAPFQNALEHIQPLSDDADGGGMDCMVSVGC